MITQRTAVITGVGAERGIGRATAHRFARDGWAVAGLDLDGDAPQKLAAELTERYGVPASAAPSTSPTRTRCGGPDAGQRRRAADRRCGAQHRRHHLAGAVPRNHPRLWNRIFAVNATGTYLVTKAFLPEMIDGGYGRVVNMSSVSAQQGGGRVRQDPVLLRQGRGHGLHPLAGP